MRPAAGAIATIYAQRCAHGLSAEIGIFDYGRNDLWLVGSAFGIGAVAGDHFESFIKRRLGKPPGERWWPFDQCDFLIGAAFLTWPLVPWMGSARLLTLLLFVACVYHPLGNWLGYKLRLRSTPW